MNEPNPDFGIRVRQRRLAMNLSEEMAAQALGLSTERYRQVEAGALMPSLDMLRLARTSLRARTGRVLTTLARPSPLSH